MHGREGIYGIETSVVIEIYYHSHTHANITVLVTTL